MRDLSVSASIDQLKDDSHADQLNDASTLRHSTNAKDVEDLDESFVTSFNQQPAPVFDDDDINDGPLTMAKPTEQSYLSERTAWITDAVFISS